MKPYINEIAKSRSYVNEFRGYNHNEGISEKEMYDCYNLTSDEYPVLSTRKPRAFVPGLSQTTNFSIDAMNGALGLAVIYFDGGSRYVFNFNSRDYRDALDDNDTSPRQIVTFGNKLVIFPDCCVFDSETRTLTSAAAEETMAEYEIGWFINLGSESEPNIQLIELGDGYEYFNDGEHPCGIYKKEGTDSYTRIERAGARILLPERLRHTGAEIANFDDVFRELYPRLSYTLGSAGVEYHRYDGLYVENVFICNGAPSNVLGDADIVQNKIFVYKDGRIGYQARWGGDTVIDEDFEDKLDIRIASIKPPLMDFVVECQNRLWGCRKGKNRAGVEVNEIYATRLGSYNEWYTLDGLADSSYVLSVATPGYFTGAIKLGNNPIFFKESCIHKIYVSASGAHQVYTLDVRGVERGSERSISVVNESVIYKGVRDVLLFDGTNVTPISDALGDVRYTRAIAGADGDKYVMYCVRDIPGGYFERYIFTFDTRRGIWHRELIDYNVHAMTAYDNRLYIGKSDGVIIHEARDYDSERERDIRYMLTSGVMGYESPEAKTLCRIDFRVRLALGASFNVWLEYDSDGLWIEAARHRGTTATPMCESVYVLPRRCDHFRYKITGTGDMKLYSVSRVYERSER